MPAIRWQYAHWRRDASLNTLIGQHLLKQPGIKSIEAIAAFQGVTYAATKLGSGRIQAWACPLDLSGQFGRYSVGFACLSENALPTDLPDCWCRMPATVFAVLDAATEADAQQWRDRCAAYLTNRGALGRLNPGVIVRLGKAVPAGAYKSMWLQCINGKAGLYRAIDLQTRPHVTLSREQIIAAEGATVTKESIAEHREILYLMETA